MADNATRRRPAQGRKQSLAHRLYTGDLSYEFVSRRRLWYIISGTLIIVSLLALAVRGLNLGIEFKGGADFTVTSPVSAGSINDMRVAVLNSGVPQLDGTTVLSVGGNQLRVQTRSLSATEVATVRGAIAKQAGVASVKVAYNLIGPSWGRQITTKAVQALIVFIVLVMLLIWIRFRDWKMSLSAIVALFHDLILTIGIYALVGFTVSPSTLIGVLTILGYSLYDTVVVFDKVSENVSDLRRGNRTYSMAANDAVNQVLVRSLNTTIIGVLPVAAILFAGAFYLGSGPLEDLGLALFVGMISGAYSSIFIATPLLAQAKEREPEMQQVRQAIARRDAKARRDMSAPAAAGVSAVAVAVAVDDAEVEIEAVDGEDQVTRELTGRRPRQRTTRSQRRG